MDDLQRAQVAALLGQATAPFESLFSSLMSSSNEQRSQAELAFNLCKQTDPNAVSLKLAHLLQFSPHTERRAMSAVLLRKLFTRDDAYLWPRLSLSTQSSIKSILLTCIRNEKAESIVKKLCDTVSDLASDILPEWPDLLAFMIQCLSSDSPKLQESAFLLFAQLSQNIGYALLPLEENLHTASLQCLGSSLNFDVKIAALHAVINFIQCLNSSSDWDRFQDLWPAMMRTLTEALNKGNEAAARETLELLIEFARKKPRFLRGKMVDVVGSMLPIAEAESFEEGARHLAIEFVITLAEARGGAAEIRKSPQSISRLFAFLMRMLLDIEDFPAWHSAENEDEDAGETSNYSVGRECLDRLAISLGGTTIVPVAYVQLSAYLAASEWQKHHAALIALARIAEGCSKDMVKNLEPFVSMVLESFHYHDRHPRVRWAAINAIGQLSTDLGPDLQNQCHQRVLPTLLAAMDDFQNPRVQAHAASAVRNFSENCTHKILTPYLDQMVHKLLELLKNGKQMVQEEALTALALVADSSQEHFQKYYGAVMPCLKAIFVNATGKSNRMLRAKSMECISLVGMAVGKDKFREDAKQFMEVLTSLQGSQMETDDPTRSYMLHAWARLCKCLGKDFLPYMSVVMPPLLQSARLKHDVITPPDSDVSDSDDESLKTITLGDKRIGIKTSVLEEKASVCKMLRCYAVELKEGFFPWLGQVAIALDPLLHFYFPAEVRKAAVSVFPELVRCVVLKISYDFLNKKENCDRFIVPLQVALRQEPDPGICANMLEALNECLKISGILAEHLCVYTRVPTIVGVIKELLNASSRRTRERAERAKAEDFDAEEGELIKEENEQEEEVFNQVREILGTLIRTFQISFLDSFEGLSTYLIPMCGKDKTAKQRTIAIRIFIDFAEQCLQADFKCYGKLLSFLLEACNDENPDVRQAAACGLGVCAEFSKSGFKPHVGEALSRLFVVIRDPNAKLPENVMAYENAVCALGKIFEFYRREIDAAQVLPEWLNCLPITNDLTQAKVAHEHLCWMVMRLDPNLFGPNEQNLPKIVSVLAKVLCGKDLATEHTASRMVRFLRGLRLKALDSAWSVLDPQQQTTFISIIQFTTYKWL